MNALRVMLARLAGFLGARPGDSETRAELEVHLEMHTAENVRRGMSPAEARRQALITAGGLTAAAESTHEQRGLPLLENVLTDVRYAARTLLRNPTFTAVAVITLALGIGANTAIFSVVRGVLLRPLPYPAPEALVSLTSTINGNGTAVSPPDFMDWRAQSRTVAGFAAAYGSQSVLTGRGDPVTVTQARVTDNTFDLLRVQPVLGRTFELGEDAITAPRVAVLNEGFWRSRFGSDSTLIGQTIVLDGFPTQVVGVAPAAMRWPYDVDMWLTTRFSERDVSPGARGARWISVVGRVRTDVSVDAAASEMASIARRSAVLDPRHNTNVGIEVTPLLTSMVGDVRTPLYLLLGAVGFVLLIACANVASLSLGRIAARDAELAVRMALGASRGRLVRTLLTESLLVAIVGGVIGLLVAQVGVRALVALAPADLPRLADVRLDAVVLGFTFLLTMATGVLFGVLPAMSGATAGLHDRLRTAGRGPTGGTGGTRSRRLMVVAEVAMAMVLLAGAGLLLRSFAHLRNVDPGFNAERVATFGVALPSTRYGTIEQQREFTATLLERLRRVPGVATAAVSFAIPLSGDNFGFTFEIRGRAPADAANEPRAQARVATPDYFATMGIPLLRGRMFNAGDRDGATQALLISSELARLYFPDENPIGQYLETGWSDDDKRFGGQVVGIVGDVRQYGMDGTPTAHMYMSYEQWPVNEYSVVVRSTVPPQTVLAAVRPILRELDADIPMNAPRALSDLVDASLGPQRFYLAMLGLFAGVAMLLAAVGIYGVIAYGVQRRKREIAIRLALGATRGGVMGMVLSEGLRLAAVGVVLGTVGALWLTRLMEALLFGVGARDPLTFVVAPLALVAVAALACVLPARAAGGLNPVETIRVE